MRKLYGNLGKCAENERKMGGKWAEIPENPFCQVSHTHERTPGSVDRDPIVIWRPANDRTFAIPRLYGSRQMTWLLSLLHAHAQHALSFVIYFANNAI